MVSLFSPMEDSAVGDWTDGDWIDGDGFAHRTPNISVGNLSIAASASTPPTTVTIAIATGHPKFQLPYGVLIFTLLTNLRLTI